MSSSEKRDSYFRMKYIAYCKAMLPPEGIPTTFEDFVSYAQFQLSVDKKVLLEDPIWSKYTPEQILVEYFANLFVKSKAERERFEATLQGSDPDFAEWAESMIESNQEQLGAGMEDRVKFVPDTLGD